jgi:hypothetical protein
MIITESEIRDSLHDHYVTGGGKTFYVGFNSMSKHYNVKEGGVTDWTGYPGSGKTELLLEVLKNTSEWYGHKHLIYMPDAGSVEEVIGKLIHKFTGKQFEKFYYDKAGNKIEIKNRITEAEIFTWLPRILKYFHIYNPVNKTSDGKTRSKAVTPKEFWDFAAENKKELGIFSAVIDSWNYMKHDIGSQRQDQWLEETLSYRNEIAERNGIHLHSIIHPKTLQRDKTGKIMIPDMHSLKGGSEWANNGKTIIIVHRDFDSGITDIKIDKAKPKVVGVQGLCSLKYDVNLGGFYENVNGTRHYAHKEPIIVEPKEKQPKTKDINPDERIEPSNELDDLPF